jgi:hypothetical protein
MMRTRRQAAIDCAKLIHSTDAVLESVRQVPVDQAGGLTPYQMLMRSDLVSYIMLGSAFIGLPLGVMRTARETAPAKRSPRTRREALADCAKLVRNGDVALESARQTHADCLRLLENRRCATPTTFSALGAAALQAVMPKLLDNPSVQRLIHSLGDSPAARDPRVLVGSLANRPSPRGVPLGTFYSCTDPGGGTAVAAIAVRPLDRRRRRGWPAPTWLDANGAL